MKIAVQTEPFDISAELADLQAGRSDIGAVASFVGLVRDGGAQTPISSMTLEHYPGMTEKALTRIAASAQERWSLQGVTVIHRVGELRPADPIVLVLTASAHRAAAFEACAYIMDYLKTEAPFWKKEATPHGAHWVDARDSDHSARARWEQEPQVGS